MATPNDLYGLLDRTVSGLEPVPDLVPGAVHEGRRQRRRVRLAVAGCAAALAATVVAAPVWLDGVGGAGPGQVPADAPSPTTEPWLEPDRYSFVLDSQCGERNLIGRFAVTVASGRVADVQALDGPAAVVVHSPELRAGVPTLGMLIDEARAAVDADADLSEISYDPTDGHPVRITIDYTKAIDDEACYLISDYQPGPD